MVEFTRNTTLSLGCQAQELGLCSEAFNSSHGKKMMCAKYILGRWIWQLWAGDMLPRFKHYKKHYILISKIPGDKDLLSLLQASGNSPHRKESDPIWWKLQIGWKMLFLYGVGMKELQLLPLKNCCWCPAFLVQLNKSSLAWHSL